MKNAKKHVSNDPPTAKSLSQLIQQFIQLQASNISILLSIINGPLTNKSL